MNVAPHPSDASELALRIIERPRSTEWVVLEVPASNDQRVADELSEAVRDMDDVAVERVHVDGAQALIDGIRRPGDAIRIVSGLDHLSEEDWRHIDRSRSRLARTGCIVLVLSERGVHRMFRGAPNLASWVGAAVWSFDDAIPVLSEEEKQARLQTLRAWSGLSDAEVIERAERDALPPGARVCRVAGPARSRRSRRPCRIGAGGGRVVKMTGVMQHAARLQDRICGTRTFWNPRQLGSSSSSGARSWPASIMNSSGHHPTESGSS
jgi:hypothetical protein